MGKIQSNLPNDSQPWGRDIESRLERIEAAVTANEVNNAARDQRIETNLLKVSELLANTAALKFYQRQISGPSREYTLNNTDSKSDSLTDLRIEFSLDKPRVVSFQYAVNYDVWPTYTSPSVLSQDWGLTSFITLNGESISSNYDSQTENYTTSNPLSSKWITSTHINMEQRRLEPGDYVADVSIMCDQNSSAASTIFFLQGDLFSINIIE